MKYTKKTYRKTNKISKAIKKYVKSAISTEQEHKVFDAAVNGQPATTAGVIYNLMTPSQGDGYNNYSGIVITQKSLEIRGSVLVGDSSNCIRMIIFRWHNDSSIDVPQPNEILQLVSTGNSPYEPYNYIHRDEFTVLKDHLFATVLGQSNALVKFNYKVKLHNAKQRFTNTTNGTGVNNIYVLFISDSAVGPNPAQSFTSRIHYTDS